ncbi:MAG: enoyl-CoA hydratase, partial [Gemmatimonadales bacterium]|nr:enoyl-CoA hydratase [Gemmatimonadales bacterium]
MGMILTGRRVSAAEGKELGFVNEVVPTADLMPAARRLAAQILELSPMSIRASKQTVLRGLDEPSLGAAMKNQAAYPAVMAMRASKDVVEGPLAFSEKRPPRWSGS